MPTNHVANWQSYNVTLRNDHDVSYGKSDTFTHRTAFGITDCATDSTTNALPVSIAVAVAERKPDRAPD